MTSVAQGSKRLPTTSKWDVLLTHRVLTKAGKSCRTTADLAEKLDRIAPGWAVTENSLFNAYKRNRKRLGLQGSLMSYMGKELYVERKKSAPSRNDIVFSLSSEKRKSLRKAKRFVVTSALNNCNVDKDVWASLKRFAKRNGAEILVIPARYKNPTSRVDGKIMDEGAWWPDELLSYMFDDALQIHEHLTIMAHVRVQATALRPITGLEALSGGSSAIFGHAQLSLSMVATPQNHLPKALYTTGTVSRPNYSTTKAGIRGKFHHSMGALVVELDGPRFHVRALVADDDGGFYDLDRYYHPKGVTQSKGALALVTGDEHVAFNDTTCREATYGKGGIADTCKPKLIVRHDVFDGYSVNHHTVKDPVVQMVKAESGFGCVREELEKTVEFLDSTTPKNSTNIIVSSNHHDHLLRWLKETIPLDSPSNARTWHELWALVLPTIKMGVGGTECGNPLALWCASRVKVQTRFLGSAESCTVAGIDISHHGHLGANGSRGTANQFAKVGVKTILGHSHTPKILHGCYQVGTSSKLNLEYTSGLSSWFHAHCIIHPNGKRQMIFIVDGKWRAVPKERE